MSDYRVVYIDRRSPWSECPLPEGYYIQSRTCDGTWAIIDRTRYSTKESAERAARKRRERDGGRR